MGGIEKSLGHGGSRLGDRVLHVLPSGHAISVKRQDEEVGAQEDNTRAATSAFTPLVLIVDGERVPGLLRALRRMEDEPRPVWPLTRERTVAWLFKYALDYGGSLEGRRSRWPGELKVSTGTAPYEVHYVGFAVQFGSTNDPTDMNHPAMAEVIARVNELVGETMSAIHTEPLGISTGHSAAAAPRRERLPGPNQARPPTNELAGDAVTLMPRPVARDEEVAAQTQPGPNMTSNP